MYDSCITIMNLTFALSLICYMPTTKARTSDNVQKQIASNTVSILYSVLSVLFTFFPSNNFLIFL